MEYSIIMGGQLTYCGNRGCVGSEVVVVVSYTYITKLKGNTALVVNIDIHK